MRLRQTICGFLVNGALRHVGESTHAQLARRKRKALVHLHIPAIVNKHRYALHTKHNWWFRLHAHNISWYVAWGFVMGSMLFSLGAFFYSAEINLGSGLLLVHELDSLRPKVADKFKCMFRII